MAKKVDSNQNYLDKKPIRRDGINWNSDQNGIVTLEIYVFHRYVYCVCFVCCGESGFHRCSIGNVSENNVEKVFATSVKETPELYIIANDTKLASMDVATEAQTIPLGVRIKQPMNVRFEKAWFSGYKQATLVDKITGEEYDLTTETYTTKRLEVGDIEGRFFLNLEEGVKEEELPEEGEGCRSCIRQGTEGYRCIDSLRCPCIRTRLGWKRNSDFMGIQQLHGMEVFP